MTFPATATAKRAVAETILDEWIPEQRERVGIVGLCAGVILPGGELLSRADGLADIEANVEMTAETPLRLASITKMFTVTAMLMARDQGLLSLDAPVRDLVPELAEKSPARAPAPITLRQCVSHTAGLPTDLPAGVEYWTPDADVSFPDFDEARQWLADFSLLVPPMTDYHYSNVGFMIAGLAVEAAFGKPYRQVIEEQLLAPLGMDGAFFGSAANLGRLAQGYRPSGKGPTDDPAPSMEVGWDSAGGGLCCTGPELARFMRLHLTDEPVAGGQVLSGSSIREARQPVRMTGAANGVGLGWWLRQVDDHEMVMHSGNMAGYSGSMMLMPELGIGAYLLTNTNRITTSALLQGLLKSVVSLATTEDEVVERFKRREPLQGIEPIVGHYGTYEMAYDVVEIGGRLAIFILDELEMVSWLEPTGEDGHYVGVDGFGAGEPAIFSAEVDGRYSELAFMGLLLRRD